MAAKMSPRPVPAHSPPPLQPPAKELAAIAARAAAAGKKPTQAAVLAIYQRNQARVAAPKPSLARLGPGGIVEPRRPAPPPRELRGSNSSRAAGRSGPGRGSSPPLPAPPKARPGHPPRNPRSVGRIPRSDPNMRAAMVKSDARFRRDVARLDEKVGLGRTIQGLVSTAKSTPVTAYYALRGAFGPAPGDAMVEAIYGRPVLEALRRGKGDEAQALATHTHRHRQPSRRGE